MDLEQQRVEIDDASIYYQRVGAGTPVVLVHGLSGSCRWWVRNIQALADRHEVFVIDLIGFGRSQHPHRFVLSDAASFLARWMTTLDITPAALIGHSMGGVIAASLAADHPELVSRLVLVDAAMIATRQSMLRSAAGLAAAGLLLRPSFWPVLFSDALAAGPFSLYAAARDLLETDVDEKLSHINIPTLVIWGAWDTAVPLSVGRDLYAHLPQARWVTIGRAGHVPMWDRPDAFNAAVLDFLAEPAERPAAVDEAPLP